MEILGLNISKTSPPQDENTSRLAVIRQGVVVLGGLFGTGTVAFALIDLVRQEPDKAFGLLKIWGPWFFLALFVAWSLNGLLAQGLRAFEKWVDRFCDSLDKVAGEQKRLADSQQVLADAAKAASEKDDRDRDRMATQIEYTSAQSRDAVVAVRALMTVVSSMAEQVSEIHKKAA